MSIKQLKHDIRRNGGYILSDGTLNMQHLLPKAHDVLIAYNINAKQLKQEIVECFTFDTKSWKKVHAGSLFAAQYWGRAEIKKDFENDSNADYVWHDAVYNFFDNLSPNGYYFGSSEGDGACIGWFKLEQVTVYPAYLEED